MPNMLSSVAAGIFSVDIDYSTATGLAQYNEIVNSINSLYLTSIVQNLYGSSDFALPSVAGNDGLIHVALSSESNNAFYSPLQFSSSNPSPDQNYVLIGDGIIANGLTLGSVDNKSYHENLSGVILHELTHALLTPTVAGGFYREESTIFMTNFVEAANGSSNERMGHGSSAIGSSASAIDYLSGLNMIDHHSSASAGSGYGSFIFEFGDSSIDIKKTYWGAGTDNLDHLVTINAQVSAVVDGSGALADGRLETILADSVAADTSAKLDIYHSIQDSLGQAMSYINSIANPDMQLNFANGVMGAFSNYHPSNLLTISAERFVDGAPASTGSPAWSLDVQGPIATGGSFTSQAPAAVTLEASSPSGGGTMMFGAGGFTDSAFSGAGSFNLAGTVDTLIGDAGNDVLFAGKGISSSGLRNVLDGGRGNNFLIGDHSASLSSSTLLGSSGNNIFVSGSAQDYLIGNSSGIQMADYSASADAVTIDLRATTSISYIDSGGSSHTVDAAAGLGGDAAGDMYVGVTSFIGTDQNDIFYGTSGQGHTFIGGGGSDVFHLSSGDTAIGGTGADTFYIDTLSSPNNIYYVIGLDESDKVYVDGELYTGRTRVMASDGATFNGHPQETGYVVSDNSGYGIVYGPASGPGGDLLPLDVVREDVLHLARTQGGQGSLNGFAALQFDDTTTGHFTNLFIAGFEQGDAGIQQSMDNPVWHSAGEGNTISILTTDENTPGQQYNGPYEAWPSWTDYGLMGQQFLFA